MHEIPKPWGEEGVFQMQYLICALNFTNNISETDLIWHNLWKLLTINFKNKYFHNPVDWSELYLQVYIPSWFSKNSRFPGFWLLENAFVKFPCPLHDLMINPLWITLPQKICQENFFPYLPWKASRKIMGGSTMSSVYAPKIFARNCRLKLANKLNSAKKNVCWNMLAGSGIT